MTDSSLYHQQPEFWTLTWPDLLKRQTHVTTCTIEIQHDEHSLHAHVSLDDGTTLGPGDRMIVQGPPIRLSFGESCTLNRGVKITRATALERLWIKIASYFELTELYEVSFTPGKLP
ncbi:hypothetical protein PbB2_00569 [Candidatus Phycosocius bacilliformis]|uniref:Uncharacterized protein n=1 Tax=Candidatus Phycosocius bacilliformis TaxID=1445552 RepID=A0A2P2E771_9PROT|nr:hypothetical protein [Candidatus Phycosocius bacilliformis]GBF56912.1 hypothetical protein PbB2_00569 [Candidatus Phycosocius bacilliformis]